MGGSRNERKANVPGGVAFDGDHRFFSFGAGQATELDRS